MDYNIHSNHSAVKDNHLASICVKQYKSACDGLER